MIARTLFLNVLFGFLSLIPGECDVVYKNTEGVTAWIDEGAYERGQTVILSGSKRFVTRFSCEYIARLNVPGNQTIRLRFYEPDFDRWKVEMGGPGKLLYDSQPILVRGGDPENEYKSTFEITNINVRVPDFFISTIELKDLAPGDHVGLRVLDAAEIGSNPEVMIWARDPASSLGWMLG